MKKIILDTNFLITAIKFKVDIFTEINRICDFNYKIFKRQIFKLHENIYQNRR